MRIGFDRCQGFYVQYKDSGHPVETIDREVYSFMNEERTCVVANPEHLQYLLTTGRYRVVGVEVEEPETAPRPSVPATRHGAKPLRR